MCFRCCWRGGGKEGENEMRAREQICRRNIPGRLEGWASRGKSGRYPRGCPWVQTPERPTKPKQLLCPPWCALGGTQEGSSSVWLHSDQTRPKGWWGGHFVWRPFPSEPHSLSCPLSSTHPPWLSLLLVGWVSHAGLIRIDPWMLRTPLYSQEKEDEGQGVRVT